MDDWNRPTPVFKRVSLNQAAWDKLIPTDLAPVLGKKLGAWKNFYSIPSFIYDLSPQKRERQVRQGCPKDFAQLAQMSVYILVSLGEHLTTDLKDHKRYDQGPDIYGKPRRVSLPVGEAQLAWCLKVWVGGLL